MQQISRRGEWLVTRVDDETVMMDVDSGRYLGLSRVGSRIWELIEQARSTDAIVAQLIEEYDVSAAQCHADVQAFLSFLADQGAIEMR